MRNLKRLTAGLLALVMLLAFLPATAMADGSDETAIFGGTVIPTEDAESGNNDDNEAADGGDAETGEGSDAETGDGSDAETGEGSDAETGEGSEAEAGEGSDAEAGEGSDAEAGEGSEAEAGEGSEAEAGEGSEVEMSGEFISGSVSNVGSIPTVEVTALVGDFIPTMLLAIVLADYEDVAPESIDPLAAYLAALPVSTSADSEQVLDVLCNVYALERETAETILSEVLANASASNGVPVPMGGELGIGENIDDDYAHLTKFELLKYNGEKFGYGIADGTSPFDTWAGVGEEGPTNYVSGDDCSDGNGVVRTFDDVTYNISYATAVYDDSPYTGFENAKIYMRITVPTSEQEAILDTSAMTWFTVTDTQNYDDNADGITDRQVITGYRTLVRNDGSENCVPGQGQLYATFKIFAMSDGDNFKPVIEGWMEHNVLTGTCPTHSMNEVFTIDDTDVKVSAAPKYNVVLTEVNLGNVGNKTEWNFDSGSTTALNYGAGVVYGRMRAYGVTLQLYNDVVAKGLRGIEFPTGPITFDISLYSTFTPAGQAESAPLANFMPLVWSFDANNNVNDSHGRAYPSGTANYAVYAAPRNKRPNDDFISNGFNSCYNGGTWATPTQSNNTTTGVATISVTVSDYEIDGSWFPCTNLGNGTGSSNYYVWNNGKGPFLNKGCFSAGKIYVVTPFFSSYTTGDATSPTLSTNTNYILNDSTANPLNVNGGQMNLHISDANMSATSVSGQPVTTQSKTDDDNAVCGVVITRGGTYDQRILYSYRTGTPAETYDFQGVYHDSGAWSSGKDWAVNGYDKGRIIWGYHGNAASETENTIYAGNALMLFDPQALELDLGHANAVGEYYNNYAAPRGLTVTYLYAAKDPLKFGNTEGGWVKDNGDGTFSYDDSEMKRVMQLPNVNGDASQAAIDAGNYAEDYFIYYPSLSALEAAGQTCVGVLAEIRPTNETTPAITTELDGDRLFWQYIDVKVKDDAELIGGVYEIYSSSRIWRQAEYQAAGTIPSMVEKNDPGFTFPKWQASINFDYNKSQYNEGTYIPSNWESRTRGDSLLIVGAKVNIDKSIDQKIGLSEMQSFDISADQRTVDWLLTPSTEVLNTSSGEDTMVTSVTIRDVVPAGLSYIYNSAVFGGNYVQNALPGRQGSVTGGSPVDDSGNPSIITYEYLDNDTGLPVSRTSTVVMTVTKETDGTTTLLWTVDNILVGEELPQIHYSTKIGTPGIDATDVKGGDQLLNKVYINSICDSRVNSLQNGNYDESGITIVGLAASSLTKQPVQAVVDKDDDLQFRLCNSNDFTGPIQMVMVDVLPFMGDGSSNYTGDLQVSSMQIQQTLTTSSGVVKTILSAATLANIKLYYTTDAKYRGMTIVPSSVAVNISTPPFQIHDTLDLQTDIETNWTELVQSPAGTAVVDGIVGVPTAIAIIGEVKGQEVLLTDVGLTTTSPTSGNVFSNRLYGGGVMVTSKGYTSSRTLEGTAWLDADGDGLRAGTEELLAGVTAKLFVYDDTGAKVELDSVQTDTNGHYKFTDVPGGDVYVQFFDGSTSVEKYTATLADQGTNDTIDSDAHYAYDADEDKSLLTIKVGMPIAESLKNNEVFSSPDHDAGFLPSIWVDNSTANDAGGTVAILDNSNAVVPGTQSNVSSDGENNPLKDRKPYSSVIATPDTDWIVKTDGITVNGKTPSFANDGTFSIVDDDGVPISGTLTISATTGAATVAIDSMDTNVDVRIPFTPTIWVENTTTGDLGGQVKVKDFGTNTFSFDPADSGDRDDDRQPTNAIVAKPDANYAVDLSNVTFNNAVATYDPSTGTLTATVGGKSVTGNISFDHVTGEVTITVPGMDIPLDIGLSFLPGIAVENTTAGDLGGTVQVNNGTPAAASDGVPDKDGNERYGETVVHGTPDASAGYMVNLSGLTIGLPASSSGDLGSNPNAIVIPSLPLVPDSDGAYYDPATGNFAASIDKDGTPYLVTGTVAPTIDAFGVVNDVQVTLTSVPVPVDVGIPFIKQPYLIIDNTTTNPANGTDTNVGGTVSIDTVTDPDEVPFTVCATQVTFAPDTAAGWRNGDTLTIYEYTDKNKALAGDHDGASRTTSIDLSDLKDADGKFTAAGATTLISRIQTAYPSAVVTVTGEQVKIVFEDDPVNMPYYTEVNIGFIPSLWVENSNTFHNGGQVSVIGGQNPASSVSSGNHDSERDLGATQVKATAETGYRIDMTGITLKPVGGTAKPVTVNPDGTFSTTLDVMQNGVSTPVTVTGTVVRTGSDAVLTFDDLPTPIDVGFAFDSITPDLMIDNTTPSNQGGTVSAGGVTDTDVVPYQPNQTVVSFKPDDGWANGNTVTVVVHDDDGNVVDTFTIPTPSATGSVDISNITGMNGKNLTDSFSSLSATVGSDGSVSLTFTGVSGIMPPRADVLVNFVELVPNVSYVKSSATPYLISDSGAAGTITYTVTVSNTGTGAALNVAVRDKLPTGVTLSGTPSDGGALVTVSGESYVAWTIPSLAAGATMSLTFSVSVPAMTAPGTIDFDNVAQGQTFGSGTPVDYTATTGWLDTNRVTHHQSKQPVIVPPPALPWLAIENTTDLDSDSVRDLIGGQVWLDGNKSHDMVGYEAGKTSASWNPDAGFLLGDTIRVNYFASQSATSSTTSAQISLYNADGTLKSDSVLTTELKAALLAAGFPPAVYGSSSLKLSISGGVATMDIPQPVGTASKIMLDVSFKPAPATLEYTKTSATPTQISSNGGEIEYVITVRNTGAYGAANVMVKDPVPAGTSFVSAADGGALSSISGKNYVVWTVATLAAGDSAQLHFTVRVPLIASDSSLTFTNTASGQEFGLGVTPNVGKTDGWVDTNTVTHTQSPASTTNPTVPGGPTTPGTPSQPPVPGKPTEPTTPPVEPSPSPVPTQPGETVAPTDEPTTPGTPAPVTPEPTVPVPSAPADSGTPQTGDSTYSLTIALVIIAVLCALSMIVMLRTGWVSGKKRERK